MRVVVSNDVSLGGSKVFLERVQELTRDSLCGAISRRLNQTILMVVGEKSLF